MMELLTILLIILISILTGVGLGMLCEKLPVPFFAQCVIGVLVILILGAIALYLLQKNKL